MGQNASLIAKPLAADIAHDGLLTAYGGHLPTININVSRNWALEHGNFNGTGPARTGGAPSASSTVCQRWWIPVICSGRWASRCRIFTGGATQSKVRQARYTWDAAKAGARLRFAPDRGADTRCLPGRDQPDRPGAGTQQAVESDRVALQATEAGYQVGTKTVVDVLTAREVLVQADTNYAQAKYGYLNDIVSLRSGRRQSRSRTLELINSWLIEPRPPPLARARDPPPLP